MAPRGALPSGLQASECGAHPRPVPQDVSAEQSLQMPELYVAGQRDELFNYGVFLQAVAHGTATSLVNFFVTLLVSQNLAGPSGLGDHQSFAVLVALSGLLSITVEVGQWAAGVGGAHPVVVVGGGPPAPGKHQPVALGHVDY